MEDSFEWDEEKNLNNTIKHGVSFENAQAAFTDPKRIIHADNDHSQNEKRYYCIGMTNVGILTVRFNKIRIIGAGYWRKGKKYYEK